MVVGLTLFGPGCALVCDATSLAVHSARETAEDIRENIRNRKWAESAWEDLKSSDPHTAYSEDYACGFKDGYAYHLFRGGNGGPPPLPPPYYRKLRYQTPQGYKAIEDWFTGFRHGADAARKSGYRHWITGPSALRGPNTVPPPLAGPEPRAVDLERPIPLGIAPPPALMPAAAQDQRPSAWLGMASPPAPVLPAVQNQRPSAPLSSPTATPVPAAAQIQRPSTPLSSPAAKGLPTIINGEATPLPTIINGETGRPDPPAG